MTNLARIIVEVGFTGSPSTGAYWHIGDPVRGRIGTAAVGPEELWTDISPWVVSVSTRRPATRADGPTLRYEAGTATILLKNHDRRFDPTNLSGPYVVAGVSQVEPMRAVRVRAEWDGVAYPILRGYVDDWQVDYQGPTGSTVTLTVSDGFSVLTSYDRPASAPVGGSERSGARIHRILTSAGWPTVDRMVDVGDSTMQATELEGNALSELQLTAESELGEFYINAAGLARFRRRRAVLTEAQSTTPQATFSGDGGAVQVADSFSRAVVGGWGVADTGQTWTTAGGAVGDYSVAAGVGVQSLGSLNVSRRAVLAGVADAEDVAATFAASAVATGAPIRAALMLRAVDPANDHYRAQLGFEIGGLLTLSLVRRTGGTDTTLTGVAVPDTYTAGTRVRVRAQADGTTLRAMAWLESGTPPTSWQTTAIDTTFDAGPPGIRTLLPTSNTNTLPVAVSVDDITAGPLDGLPELPYADVAITYDAQSIYNLATVSRAGGTPQVVEDPASRARYLTRTYQRSDLLLETDAEVLSYGRYVLHQASEPELRFSQMTLLPRGDARLWAQALGREFGDRIRVIRRPPGGGVIRRDVFVRGVEHDVVRDLQWTTRLTLQSASSFQFWTIGHVELGRIGVNAIGF
ncbi:hypothetical protein [Micromonospora sp. NPDC023956]|uniref:hypothetical protein n=1 Tax=Micromonospora sp. NPDC023956 TaxID=3155722 RepID=UPI0033F4022E